MTIEKVMEEKEEMKALMSSLEDVPGDERQKNKPGSIRFWGVTRETKARFIVLEEGSSAKEVWKQMRECMKMKRPRLIISVVGSARPFYLEPRIETSFKAAILKLSQIRDAWIITGGAYSGVMKIVGDALEETYSKICLGISTWNDVADKSNIAGEDKEPYIVGSLLENRGLYLDYRHTHFLIVKEKPGSRNAQNKFRADLEQHLRVSNSGLPTVLLVVNGGFGTLECVFEYVTKVGSPVVIVRHSGRCADLLAYGCDHWEDIDSEDVNGIEHEELFQKMRTYLIGEEDNLDDKKDMRTVKWNEVKLYSEECDSVQEISDKQNEAVKYLSKSYGNLLECLKKKVLFSFAELDSQNNIETAILNGLLAASDDTCENLKQTLLFNRADIARSYILRTKPIVEDSKLRDLLIMALQRGDHAFVKLLMDCGANMHKELDASAMESLYGYQLFEDNFLLKKIVAEYFKKWNLEMEWENILSFKNIPHERKPLPRKVIIAILNELCKRFRDHRIYTFETTDKTLDGKLVDPFWDLFLWAIICNMPEMADFLWPFGRNQIAKALVGAEMLENLASIDTNTQQATDILIKSSEKYRLTGHDLLDELSARSEEDTRKLTTALLPPHVPTLTCLEMAVKVKDYGFVANSTIQTILWDVWTGPTRTRNVTARDYLKFMVSIIFPFVIVSFDTEMAKEESGEEEWDMDDESGQIRSHPVHSVQLLESEVQPVRARYNGPYTLWEKLYLFYCATPIVTFLLHLWGSIIFLVLYSYLVMTDQSVRKEYTPLGILLCLYFAGYVVGEIYQICMYDAEKISTKCWCWISDPYNQVDFYNIILFLVASLLGLYPATHGVSHTCHSINCGLWIIRFSTVIRIFPNLGLYLEMITTMFVGLSWFLIILVVFILAFFVTSTSLLYPGNSAAIDYWQMFLRSWFSIYGEHFLEIKPDDNSTTTLTTPKINSYDEYVVWVIMGIYLLATNIVLFNIIIAAFNTTYVKIQTNSNTISKYRIYDLVVEYSNRVPTPPPLSLIHHSWKLFRWIYRRVTGTKSENPAMKKLRHHPEDENEKIRLRNFEHYYALKVWKEKLKKEDVSVDESDQVFQNIEVKYEKHMTKDEEEDSSDIEKYLTAFFAEKKRAPGSRKLSTYARFLIMEQRFADIMQRLGEHDLTSGNLEDKSKTDQTE